jgi:DNA repair protein RecO (recombination protein O)
MQKTPVIVLHRYPFSESSFVVKALSPEMGVISFMVKGARRKESKFRVALDPLAIAEVVYQNASNRELQIPREATLLRYHEHLRGNLLSLAMAQVMSEVVLRISLAGGHFQEEYALLKDSLSNLDQEHPQTNQTFALANFLRGLAEGLGIGFRLDACIECHDPLKTPPADLWPALGGGVCSKCLGTRHAGWTQDFLVQMFDFITKSVTYGAPMRLEHFFIQFLKIHTGQSLAIRSLEWLETVRKVPSTKGSDHAASQ